MSVFPGSRCQTITLIWARRQEHSTAKGRMVAPCSAVQAGRQAQVARTPMIRPRYGRCAGRGRAAAAYFHARRSRCLAARAQGHVKRPECPIWGPGGHYFTARKGVERGVRRMCCMSVCPRARQHMLRTGTSRTSREQPAAAVFQGPRAHPENERVADTDSLQCRPDDVGT